MSNHHTLKMVNKLPICARFYTIRGNRLLVTHGIPRKGLLKRHYLLIFCDLHHQRSLVICLATMASVMCRHKSLYEYGIAVARR
jgi:hypothetical protein